MYNKMLYRFNKMKRKDNCLHYSEASKYFPMEFSSMFDDYNSKLSMMKNSNSAINRSTN